MFIFVIQTLRKKWNDIFMKQLAGGKHMEYDCFPKTLKFEMHQYQIDDPLKLMWWNTQVRKKLALEVILTLENVQI
jgi:hypothetical protein